jgi:hypothetical protein
MSYFTIYLPSYIFIKLLLTSNSIFIQNKHVREVCHIFSLLVIYSFFSFTFNVSKAQMSRRKCHDAQMSEGQMSPVASAGGASVEAQVSKAQMLHNQIHSQPFIYFY